MKCYNCGREVAGASETCAACGCPTDREQAVKYFEIKLMTEQIDAESSLDQLHKAKIAMFVAAFVTLVSGVFVLFRTQGDTLMLVLGLFMIVMACGYVALALFIRKAPLPLSIVGLLLGVFVIRGFPGLLVLGAMTISIVFAVMYTRAGNRIDALERKIKKLK